MGTSDKSESDNLDADIVSTLKKRISDEPIEGESLNDLSEAERITIESTKLRKIKKKIHYRVLYPKETVEIAMIINPTISSTIARAALTDLIRKSKKLHKDGKQELSLGARIYWEYQDLIENHGWTQKDVMLQVTYDLNLTWLMKKMESTSSLIYKYADIFQDALIEYLRKPETKLQDVLDNFDINLEDSTIPFTMSYGFEHDYVKSFRHISDANSSWADEFLKINYEKTFSGVLICFWCVSYLCGYWEELEKFSEMGSFKRKHRSELVSAYIESIEKYLPDLYSKRNISLSMLNEFLKEINRSYT